MVPAGLEIFHLEQNHVPVCLAFCLSGFQSSLKKKAKILENKRDVFFDSQQCANGCYAAPHVGLWVFHCY